jgi:hypothetical protein
VPAVVCYVEAKLSKVVGVNGADIWGESTRFSSSASIYRRNDAQDLVGVNGAWDGTLIGETAPVKAKIRPISHVSPSYD